jgi:hypothetical protein
MFGLSLPKILLTVLAALAAWYGYRWWTRLQERREAAVAGRRDEFGQAFGKGESGSGKFAAADEMVLCPSCRTYVAKQAATSCGRDNCPFPG